MIADTYSALFAGCTPEIAFIAGFATCGVMAFEWIVLGKLLDAIFDGIRCLLKKLWRWFRNRKRS